MNKRERVRNAIEHRASDRCPHNVELTSEAMKKFCAFAGIKKDEFPAAAENHIDKLSFNGGRETAPGYFQDEFSVVWNRTGVDKDIGVVEEYILKDADLSALIMPELNVEEIREKSSSFLVNGGDTFRLAKIGMLLFERAWSLRGMENLLLDMYESEKFVEGLFEKITNYNLMIINEALKYQFDGFYFGDDYGQQRGMIMGPALWRKFIKPCLAKMFEPIKAKGLPVILHSCGDIEPILGDLIEIGLDVYQTVQPEIYDLEKLQKNYGKDLCFYGAISTQKTLATVKPEELKLIIRKTIETMNIYDGYICAPTHQIQPDVPVENILAVIDVMTGK
jgi:uroporphyrinogen decarboxylase